MLGECAGISGTHHRVNNSYAQWWVYGGVGEGGTTQKASLDQILKKSNDRF